SVGHTPPAGVPAGAVDGVRRISPPTTGARETATTRFRRAGASVRAWGKKVVCSLRGRTTFFPNALRVRVDRDVPTSQGRRRRRRDRRPHLGVVDDGVAVVLVPDIDAEHLL